MPNTATTSVAAPQTWRNPEDHLAQLLTNPWYRSIARFQTTLADATSRFWRNRGAISAFLPITTDAVSSPMGLGSNSTAVPVSIGGSPTHLADSMQFGLELMCRLNSRGAYYVMPSFRGESCDATHLSQFFHSEAELPVELPELQQIVQEYVVSITAELLESCRADLVACSPTGVDHINRLLATDAPFTRMTFDEAVDDLADSPAPAYTDASGRWRTLSRESETLLMQRHGSFLWIERWDALAVPFYQATEGGRALNADLLFGPGEVVGAGQRNATADSLRTALQEHSLKESDYAWYVAMKERSPLTTAGFGMGVERYLMWLTGHSDIRDFQLLLRDNGRTFAP